MTDVAIVSYASAVLPEDTRNEQELLLPVLTEVMAAAGVTTGDIGFVCSGSSDYLIGQPFSFVAALDAVGPWPPLRESHVEMDAAWALYEAWLWLQSGEVDTALVYGFGKTSMSDVARTMALQLDPYVLAPLVPDAHGLAGLQAQALRDAGVTTAEEVAAVALRVGGVEFAPGVIGGPVSDGAAAIVLAVGDRARELTDRPVWIRGIDHRIEPHGLGLRDLTDSASTRQAAREAGATGTFDLAELHTRYAHEEPLLRAALGLGPDVAINPSGGPLASDPVMATGLMRLGEAAVRLQAGEGRRAIAHATSGPCLQQNLVAVLEVDEAVEAVEREVA